MSKSRILPFLILLMVISSCDDNQIFDQYQSLPKYWNKDSVKTFSVVAPDTINSYNLYVNLRNNNDYKYSNLMLIVEMDYPNGKAVKDTLEYRMANPQGEFLGTGFTDVKENKLWYKGYEEPFVFSESGKYTVGIQQAMRENGQVSGITNLEGITDVGFRIERTK
ncbi:gliding motility lipoprotein GldH [Aegicerativicinus sediminis]|uniref:gliding motility lipoprotein GldH n=1 Tax=Aegicerativicinus sediminis TaxID=2893202 RepID=UPI0021D24383|nr:gliding motility lipoprotein GldH [Aegicerativicinus sediminis]